jgi:beta-phosphoglucomutase-like phosphatase (HAD superfamily)
MSSSAPGGHGLKAIIFDLDGVVANTHPIHLQAWKAFLTEEGLDLPDVDLSFLYAGRSRKDIFPQVFRAAESAHSRNRPQKAVRSARGDCTVIRGA